MNERGKKKGGGEKKKREYERKESESFVSKRNISIFCLPRKNNVVWEKT